MIEICVRNSNDRLKGYFLSTAFKGMMLFFFIIAATLYIPPTASAGPETVKNDSGLIVAPSPKLAASTIAQELAANFPELTSKTTTLVINIAVNTEVKGDFFVERDINGNLFMSVQDTVTLKLQIARDRVVLINGEQYVPLSALRDVSCTFDEKKLTVSIIGKTTESRQTTIEFSPLETRPQNLYYPQETSAFVNYGINYSYADQLGSHSYAVSNRIGARTGDFFFISDSLYTKTDTNQQFVRLQSSATYEWRNDLQWLVVGDQFANSGTLGSTVNMGGIGFSKLYRLDPYSITQPVFDVSGVSKLPSEADIYLDGVLVSKKSIAPGQFDLANVYSYAGAHKLDIVLKDAFGNEQHLSYPLYFGTQLLREGLHEYSYNVGFLREQYGTDSNDYSKPVFSAFHRYGVTSAFNIGAEAEGTDRIYNGGVSTGFSFPHIGVFVVSAAASDADGLWGTAGSFQHSYQNGSFNTNLLVQAFSRDYTTVASTSSTSTQYAASLSVGFQLDGIGNISLGCSLSEIYDGAITKVISAGYSRQLSNMIGLFATASTTYKDSTSNNAVYIGLNFTFENNLHGTASYNKTGDTNTEMLQIQKDTPVGEGVGYYVNTSRTENTSSTTYGFNPGFQYNAPYGTYTFDAMLQNANHGTTTNTYNLSAAGALVYAGGFFAASRPVNDSFSFVMVDNLPNATILNNGQEIGTTNSSGIMVLPNLTSYGQNQITLDVKNLPIDYSITGVNKMISPSIWSGSCVSFDAIKIQAVTGHVYVKTGDKKVPLEYIEISMKVGDREVTFPTGKEGEFYVENVLSAGPTKNTDESLSCKAIAERMKTGSSYIKPGTYPAWGEFEGKKCQVSITFPMTKDVITDLGEVQCDIP